MRKMVPKIRGNIRNALLVAMAHVFPPELMFQRHTLKANNVWDVMLMSNIFYSKFLHLMQIIHSAGQHWSSLCTHLSFCRSRFNSNLTRKFQVFSFKTFGLKQTQWNMWTNESSVIYCILNNFFHKMKVLNWWFSQL